MRVLILLALFSAHLYSCYTYCYTPNEPYCASSYGSFNSEYQFESCKREVENYIEELTQYLRCVQKQVEQCAQEAINDFNQKAQR